MASRDTRRDPKEAALAGARCLNPHPEQVTDPEFLASDFFDARDAVQAEATSPSPASCSRRSSPPTGR